MAVKIGGGSTNNGRDSHSKRLGQKRSEGEKVNKGEILYRQRGRKMQIGINTYYGKDNTIHASEGGKVKYTTKRKRKIINVIIV